MKTRIVLAASLVALLLLPLPGCHAFSRSRHVIEPPVTRLERRVEQTVPKTDETLTYEIEIFPSEEWEEVKP